MKAESNSLQCSEDLGSIAVAVRQDQLLQEAFVCGKPETTNSNQSDAYCKKRKETDQNFTVEKQNHTLCQG